MMDDHYAASVLKGLRQTFEGEMEYAAVTTTTLQDLLGRPPIGLRQWAERHKQALLAASMTVA